MTVKYSGFEHFLANNVVYRVGSLIALYPKANAVFKKHIDRIITAAERYGEWLRAEYKKAEKRGLTDLRKQLHGKGYRTFICSGWDWRDVFFETAGGQRYLWIKGEPRPNPLDYLRSMVWGRISKPPRGISLLDYQYFLVACIYDSQCRPEQRRIYFSPEPEDSVLWDKQLKDRICRRVWLVLVKGQRETLTQIDITRDQMIEPALRAIEAELTGGGDAENTGTNARTRTKARTLGTMSEIAWDQKDPNYIPASEAIVTFTESKLPLYKLSKMLTPDGAIRYMRKRPRCRVHIGDFRTWAHKEYPLDSVREQIADDVLADRAARQSKIDRHKLP